MNLRHAAALALVSWYLMMPPINRTHGLFLPDMCVGLQLWNIEQTLGSEDECNRALADLRASPPVVASSVKYAESQQLVYAICIASDDPRIKENQVVVKNCVHP